MKKRTSKAGSDKIHPPTNDLSLIKALKRDGFIAPETDEDARRFLDRFSDSSTTLPPVLQDTDAVVDLILGEEMHLPKRLQSQPETEQARSLRRAARKGTSISPEIEEALRQAREAEDDE
ncbi:MAG: hypothetical protein ACE5G0_01165 [Rhodothermales bacterium]